MRRLIGYFPRLPKVRATGSTTARSLADRFADRFNVLDYGASGSASASENQTAFAAAVTAASAAGGGLIVFPGVDFNVAATGSPLVVIAMASNVSLFFEPGARLLLADTAADAYSIIDILDVTNVEIIGGTIVGDRVAHTGGSGEQGHGIHIRGATDVVIDNTIVEDCWGDGCRIAAGVIKWCERVRLIDFKADNNRRNGLTITSGRDIKIIRPKLINTNGTDPQAGLDIEPAASTNILEGIVIESPFTKANVGPGISISLTNLDGTNKIIDISVYNFRSETDIQGISISTLDTGLQGHITFYSPVIVTADDQGILVRNYGDTDTPVISFHNPTVIDPNNDGNSSGQYGSGIVVYREVADSGAATIGNVHIYQPIIEDRRGTPKMSRGIFIDDLNLGSEANISIIDPIKVSGAVVAALFFEGTGVIRDPRELLQDSFSIADPGFEKFPSGLIIQWGEDLVPGSGSLTVTLPVTVPTANLNLMCSMRGSSAQTDESVSEILSTSQIKLWNNNGSDRNIAWTVKGH